MKKYKIRVTGMGLEAVGIIPFPNEPTIEEVEDATALYINEKLMKVELDENLQKAKKMVAVKVMHYPMLLSTLR